MKFIFCGDLDCPDWILTEINTLSKLTSIKLKVLCQAVVKSFLNETVDEDKINKVMAEAKLNENDKKAILAALHFIFTSAAKFNCPTETLLKELQQLGLPKEHSVSLGRSYSEHCSRIFSQCVLKSLKFSKLLNISSEIEELYGKKFVKLRLSVEEKGKPVPIEHEFYVSPENLGILLSELKKAQNIINNM